MIDAKLIKVKQVFKTSQGDFCFEVFRGLNDYWHLDVECNGQLIESSNNEVLYDKFDFVFLCKEIYKAKLGIEFSEEKAQQEVKWHITINNDKKYNLLLSDINAATHTFRATLINEEDSTVSKKFDLKEYGQVDDLFADLYNKLTQK